MKDSNLTIAFIGCGNMGGAVLMGLLDTLYPSEDTTTPTSNKISTFIACTKSENGAKKLRQGLGHHASRVQVLASQNLAAMEAADVIVLGCKPYFARDVLLAPGVRDALEGKFVISLLAGMTANDTRMIIQEGSLKGGSCTPPHIAKVVPNVAARYRESMTILELSDPPTGPLPPQESELLQWIFNQIGTTKFLPENLVNNGGMLITNTLAALSVALEGLLDGAVVGGLRRFDAMDLAVQGIKGLGAMLENDIHPAVMRESISSPKGSTIQSLMTVEKAATRAVFAQAQIDGTNHLKPKEEK
ncbi:Fc.00g066260.m01.CDS01 [Cosmosporella sp. VM-42]